MNILISGGAGFIGSHLINKLLMLRYNIIIVVKRSTNLYRIKDILKKIKVIVIDDENDIENVFKQIRIDYIIHLAGKYVKIHTINEEIKEMIKSNIIFPSLLLNAAVKYKVKGFINTGTCFEYKLTNKKISEDDVIQPYDYYASTKLAFEEILKFYSLNYNIKALTLKLFYPFGEKDNKKLITLIISSIINNEPLNLTKGEQKLDYTYITDIIDAYIKSLKYIKSSKTNKYEVFNIGSDKVCSIKYIVRIIKKLSQNNNPVKLGEKPYSNKEIMYMNCNYMKAKKLLGWNPKVNIEEGLRKVYNYHIKSIIKNT